MAETPNSPNPGELIDKFLAKLPEKIKLWRFVGKMAVQQVNKRLVDQVDNYSTREPKDPPVVSKTDAPSVQTSEKPETEVIKSVKSKKPSVASRVKLPVANYDDLSAIQIVGLLSALNKSELKTINKYETSRRARKTILSKIEQLSNETN